MTDPDLQMGGGGDLPDPEIRGTRLGFQKNIFSVLWGSVWSKNEGGGGGDGLSRHPPLDPPLPENEFYLQHYHSWK